MRGVVYRRFVLVQTKRTISNIITTVRAGQAIFMDSSLISGVLMRCWRSNKDDLCLLDTDLASKRLLFRRFNSLPPRQYVLIFLNYLFQPIPPLSLPRTEMRRRRTEVLRR